MANLQYNPANQKTYDEILAGYQSMQQGFMTNKAAINQGYSQMIADNAGYGESDRMNLRNDYARQAASLQQQAIGQGNAAGSNFLAGQLDAFGQYQTNQALLNDQLRNRQTGLQQAQLGYLGQAEQYQAGLAGQALDFRGQALGQRYNAEANYVSQYDLANQNADLSRTAANQGYQLNANLQQSQQNYALQTMAQQNRNQRNFAEDYGYF